MGRLFHMPVTDARHRARELLDRFDLTEAGDRVVKGYSGGMRRRLDIAMSRISRPSVLFLDEAERLAGNIMVIDRGTCIAEGTATELKRDIGGDRVEVTLARNEDLARTTELLRPRATGAGSVDEKARTVCIPVTDTHKLVPRIVRELDDDGIEVLDVVIRRPTLDDVFLQLTGHGAEEITADPDEDAS